jgi:hypothetical protein
MVRKVIGMAAVVALALVLPPAVDEALGQCATGCISSSSCAGTGKSGCSTACGTTAGGVPFCSCQDSQCGTQLRPTVVAGMFSGLMVSNVEKRPFAVALLVDCHSNILDVRLLDPESVPILPDLHTIRFQRTQPTSGDRFAVRE